MQTHIYSFDFLLLSANGDRYLKSNTIIHLALAFPNFDLELGFKAEGPLN